MHRTCAIAVIVACAASSALAVNKCTLADGKIVYQDAPCDSSAKSSEPIKTWENTPAASTYRAPRENNAWQFLRRRDDMTGELTCGAFSPDRMLPSGPGFDRYASLYLSVIVGRSGEFVGLVSTNERDSFHNALSGSGLKLDNGPFVPLTVKANSTVLSVQPGQHAVLVDQLKSAASVRVRVRFWPYDTLRDSPPIPMAGFAVALNKARECAEADVSAPPAPAAARPPPKPGLRPAT